MAFINLAILLLTCQQLGVDVRGQVSLLIINIAIIQIINEIYTGYVLVYFIPRFSLKKIYVSGIFWAIICTIVCVAVMLMLFVFFEVGSIDHWIHLILLSLLIITHSFHMVIILAKERIKVYNLLNFFQPALLLSVLLFMFFVCHIKTIDSYIIALYVSFFASILLSIAQVIKIFKNFNNNLILSIWHEFNHKVFIN